MLCYTSNCPLASGSDGIVKPHHLHQHERDAFPKSNWRTEYESAWCCNTKAQINNPAELTNLHNNRPTLTLLGARAETVYINCILYPIKILNAWSWQWQGSSNRKNAAGCTITAYQTHDPKTHKILKKKNQIILRDGKSPRETMCTFSHRTRNQYLRKYTKVAWKCSSEPTANNTCKRRNHNIKQAEEANYF